MSTRAPRHSVSRFSITPITARNIELPKGKLTRRVLRVCKSYDNKRKKKIQEKKKKLDTQRKRKTFIISLMLVQCAGCMGFFAYKYWAGYRNIQEPEPPAAWMSILGLLKMLKKNSINRFFRKIVAEWNSKLQS